MNEALRNTLRAVLRAGWDVPFYRDLWRVHGLATAEGYPERLASDAFSDIPIVRKTDLQQSADEIMRWDDASDVVSSSGTTGRPVDIPVLFEEEKNRVERVCKTLREIGVTRGSRVLQLLSLNDMFALGPQMWLAIKSEGALAIRCQASRLKRALDVIRYIKPDFVVGNPHVMVQMAEEGIASGLWPDTSTLPKAAIFAVAATFEADLRPSPVVDKVSELWGIEAYTSQYGCSEAGTLAHECRHHRGYHINEADTLIELIDVETQLPALPGNAGEVVITALSLPRGFLPIRYGTGDIAAWLDPAPCPCGRTSARLGPIIGRRDHQLKLKGQTVFPELLLEVVDQTHLTKHAAVGICKNALEADEVTVMIVPTADLPADEVVGRIEKILAQHLPMLPKVSLIEESDLRRMEERKCTRTNGVKIPRIFAL
ncbi:MAG: phenylacetate--CoA ligase family protein [Defluviicoccus sp.]|nr:MAG: phenylacetate--CoA ligase family protein [Defluviicoccus sp.]